MHDTIINPMTGRKVSIYGNLGRSILNNYIQTGGGQACVYNSTTKRCRKGVKDEKDDPVNCIWNAGTKRCNTTKGSAAKLRAAAAAKPRVAAAAKPRVAAAAKPRTPAAANPRAAAAKPKADPKRKSPTFKSVALAARAGIRMRKDANRRVRFEAVAAAPKKAAPKKVAPKKVAPNKVAPKKAAPAKKAAAKPKADKMFKPDGRLSARSYYDAYGADDTVGDLCKPNKKKGNNDDKCLLKRVNNSPYWAAKLKAGNWPEQDGRNVCSKKCKLEF